MADQNPTGDGDAVTLAIPAEHRKFLRDLFEIARNGIREELAQYPKQLKEPRRLHREEVAYEKLLAALDSGSIVPGRDVRDVLRDLAGIYDRENEYERVVTEHEALNGLLGQLGGARAMFVDIAARFGDNLARHRKRADLSQEDLSRLASLNRTEISQLERGLRLCRVDTLIKLTCSLEISADELLAGISWSPGDYRPGGFKEAEK